MVLVSTTRQMFVDHGYVIKACERLNTENWDDEFLISRLLFLSTYGTTVDLPVLIANHRLANSIVSNLEKHAKRIPTRTTGTSEHMEDMALTETLKLFFNVTHYCKEKLSEFEAALAHIVALLWRQEVPTTRPLDPPFGPLVNALVNFDFSTDKSKAVLYAKPDTTKVSARITHILDISLKQYQGNDLDSVVTPVVGVVSKLYENAPLDVQKKLQKTLLPTPEDRQSVLGTGTTLSARLLKNSTNPLAPALRNAISHLQFDLSDKDASKFVENVGYGFASGFLFQNNVPIPTSASEAFSTADAGGKTKDVNPITGQFLDKEMHPKQPEMTQEEKEREAERLFVLFERFVLHHVHHLGHVLTICRLKKNGVIDVQNPVEKAFREGKFRELDEDDVEEVD